MEAPIETPTAEVKPDRTLWYVGGGCLLLLCLSIAFVVLGWSLYGSQLMDLAVGQPTEIVIQTSPPLPITDEPGVEVKGNTLGDPNATVTIIVYSDFQCPYCERYWRETEPQIIENYVNTGKVYYIYRSMGAFIGPESQASAEAAYCAGDQGQFWKYHDLLFENQTGENQGAFSKKKLLGFAEIPWVGYGSVFRMF